jgi:DNA-nicking Smr family endonuclease
MAIEGRLDLHGLTQTQAHRALDGFIVAQHEAGKRCVLVITGKGGARPDRDDGRGDGRDDGGNDSGWRPAAGVLRELTPRWLSAPGLRPRVVAWHPAQLRHGGAGALYVLLRRHRSK